MATKKPLPVGSAKKPVPRIEFWINHLGKYNYRMVGGIYTTPETIGGGANQGFNNWNGVVKNIMSQAAFKGMACFVSKQEVRYYIADSVRNKILFEKFVPVFKVKKPR